MTPDIDRDALTLNFFVQQRGQDAPREARETASVQEEENRPGVALRMQSELVAVVEKHFSGRVKILCPRYDSVIALATLQASGVACAGC